MSEPVPWHRLFEVVWWDLCRGSALDAEAEHDLSLKQQFLDLTLIRKRPGPLPEPLPDGFEDLADFNAVTFKSSEEALDWWALCELIGHFVNLRKQSSSSMKELLPSSAFRLFAVSVRYPRDLAGEVELTEIRPGVYDLHVLTLRIRIIVVHRLPMEAQNAMLLWMSDDSERKRYGTLNYRPRSEETTTTLSQYILAQREDSEMANKIEEFIRQQNEKLLSKMLEERLKELPVEERLKGLPAEERLKGLPAEERLKGLPAEERLKGLSAEEVMQALPPEVLEALAQRLKSNGSSPR
jgi:hypothetical protein